MRISDWSSDVCSSDLPDLDSAVPAELVAVAGRLNTAFRRPGSGWAIFVEAQRHGAATYPASMFADSASGVVGADRHADIEAAGAHLLSSYFIRADHNLEHQFLMRSYYAGFGLEDQTT